MIPRCCTLTNQVIQGVCCARRQAGTTAGSLLQSRCQGHCCVALRYPGTASLPIPKAQPWPEAQPPLLALILLAPTLPRRELARQPLLHHPPCQRQAINSCGRCPPVLPRRALPPLLLSALLLPSREWSLNAPCNRSTCLYIYAYNLFMFRKK